MLITDASDLLNSSGLFYLNTMEEIYEEPNSESAGFCGNNQPFIHCHQLEYIVDCMKGSGLKIIDIEKKDYPQTNGTLLTDLIIIAKKK